MEWIKVEDAQPILEDYCVLAHFETGSIETVHIQDWFGPITSGIDAEGNQTYTKWYLVASPTITHWQPIPPPPTN